MLSAPNANLFVKLHRAGVVWDREIGDRLNIFSELLEQRMDRLQLGVVVPPGFEHRRDRTLVDLGRRQQVQRVTDNVVSPRIPVAGSALTTDAPSLASILPFASLLGMLRKRTGS